ncbi:glycogen biosynthesis protein GlgD [Bacillus sp. HMF5848]|uniref:glycogen biosynthesis protein GlgD n=1 Tax=Bacillus sp. HMF5848 TaxID=2495421 RepID=UPI000F7A8906|nr:glycogen biosynthesis protein GlgD [Bacillus sp. HMF5848]RSK28244.1 glycogen biosynthesis protein GlgD [Bacillus sp. HMF5848]
MVRVRSKQNNPEQKTKNGVNSNDIEFASEFDPVKQAKKQYLEQKGSQPVKSKQHQD